MKKIGIILAALVIALFLVGTVAAMREINPPEQRESFCEDSAVQGVGYIWYDKTILDKAIGIDVHENLQGETGVNGSFAMTIYEELNEGMRIGNSTVAHLANLTTLDNFKCEKTLQFEAAGAPVEIFGMVRLPFAVLFGEADYNTPAFYGGIGARVTEDYTVLEMQKDETTTIRTTAPYLVDGATPDKDKGPFNAQKLSFDTKNAFVGDWGTVSTWKKVCTKNIRHEQFFSGEFQVDKTLLFKEEVTKGYPGKCVCGDC